MWKTKMRGSAFREDVSARIEEDKTANSETN